MSRLLRSLLLLAHALGPASVLCLLIELLEHHVALLADLEDGVAPILLIGVPMRIWRPELVVASSGAGQIVLVKHLYILLLATLGFISDLMLYFGL